MKLPKVNIKKVLYATDLSEGALYALSYAVFLANSHKASLTILHVVADDPNLDAGIAGYIGEEKWEKIKNRATHEAREALIGKKREHLFVEEALDHITKNVGDDIGEHIMDETIIVKGNPVTGIVETAREKEMDLIVMGSYGHGGIMGDIIGSTAQRVIRRSSIPVLVVHLPDHQ